MNNQIVQEKDFRYIESGKGQPIIILHGLMGGLSNFHGVLNYFPKKGNKVLIPELPVYSQPVLNTSVKSLSKFFCDEPIKRLVLSTIHFLATEIPLSAA